MMNNKTNTPYHVYAASIHGGYLISRHSTQELAEKALIKANSYDSSAESAKIIKQSIPNNIINLYGK